jgi:predicted Zn finger-like uncharacterized protein
MTCTCPKCHAQIEIDLSRIPENGTFTPCPECKSRFWTNKESYARRALTKEGKIYCDQCGKDLEHALVCTACGVMYPDYYLVQSSKPPRRQIEKPNLFSLSFSLKPAKPTYTYTTTYTSTKGSQVGPSISFQKIASLVVLILMVVGIGYFYHMKKTEQQFSKNYIRALYAIMSGTDISLNTCAKISADWKAKNDAGQNFTPRIKEEDETRLNRVKEASDNIMKTLNEPPIKLVNSKEKLDVLYKQFNKAHSLALAPSGSLSNFTIATVKVQNDFNTELKDLKTSLPDNLAEELNKAKIKYKILQNI